MAQGAFRSADLGEIIDWYAGHVKVRLSTEPGPSPALHVEDHEVGPIRVARTSVSTDLTLVTGSSEVYALAVVGAGAMRVAEGTRQWTLTPGTAGIYRPAGVPRSNRVAARTELTYLQIRARDLERHLEDLLQEYISGPVDFHPELAVQGRPAWLRMFQAFSDVLDDPRSLLRRSLITRPLSEALFTALLCSADHPYRPRLLSPVTPARPRYVRVAVDAIRADPEHPWTVALLARIAGVSVRSLQQGFREHLGMSPLSYLRRVRLGRVHDHLRRAEATSVTEAAYRWGFTHLGRFSRDYAAVYGVPPSTTLRRNPGP